MSLLFRGRILAACVGVGVVGAFAVGCGGSSNSEAPRPDYELLFDPQPAATPDVLRGVWGVTQTSKTGTANLRFRFTDGKIIGGARCTFDQAGATPLTTGQTTTLEADSLDAKTGKFTPGTALNFQTTGSDPGLKTTCSGALALQTYDFEIQSTTMTLTVKGTPTAAQILTKIGD